jgi:hypothetical protein
MKIFSNFRPESHHFYDEVRAIDKPITLFFDYIPQSMEQLNVNPYNLYGYQNQMSSSECIPGYVTTIIYLLVY